MKMRGVAFKDFSKTSKGAGRAPYGLEKSFSSTETQKISRAVPLGSKNTGKPIRGHFGGTKVAQCRKTQKNPLTRQILQEVKNISVLIRIRTHDLLLKKYASKPLGQVTAPTKSVRKVYH